jgi:hypothetical protein
MSEVVCAAFYSESFVVPMTDTNNKRLINNQLQFVGFYFSEIALYIVISFSCLASFLQHHG